ncbi:2-octaprenyl-6-methoxyphenyl hydroxylase [Denitrificimonas sp. JX-1]|uniref:2-octaprenyl-6-methoxyphenyl hydroxylase n=1 Tax=Denitrificimonas halotolerans TaxID=3098930 RepID=A0ABU5GRU5_9GAMM|nr:2-octaprenyl-6-methoxyphenyl hydroxylase [Denitrificimonas sp. JX-1]MDY7218353.1 2-octaprenyl-6-methoxyphenyl hydroxylase [Denitrificimonas sp. JX-1]
MSRVQIAIIGGGLVGASLALALQAGARERQWKIILIEPFAPGDGYQPSYDARSSALSYGSQQIYQRLGLWEAIAHRAEAIVDIHISDRGRFAATRLSANEENVPALGYVVENAWLGHCLWASLDPTVVEWRCPARVKQLQALNDGYHLILDDDSTLDCDLAILADGGRSGLREQLGIHARKTPYGQTALISNISTALPHQGTAFERFTDDGPLALLPMSENRSVLIWTREPNEAQRLSELSDPDFLQELQECFGYRLGAFEQVGQRHLYPLSLVESSEQVRAHLVVLGNAAHSLHPVAGQGYNLSLRDTMALTECLLSGPKTPGDLTTLLNFQHQQQLDQALTIGFSDRVTRLFSTGKPLFSGGRNLGLLGLDLFPPAKHWFARQAMGLGVRPTVIKT